VTGARRALAVALLAVTPLALAKEQPAERPVGWYAIVKTTLGSFTVHLLPEQAPQTVAHFAAYAQGRLEFVDPFTGNTKKVPFYDGLKIHKVKYATRFEAGDPTATGHGMPLAYVPHEQGPVDFAHPYRMGMTASSLQRISAVLFFVSMVAEPYLNSSHNCFGEVVEGREVIDRICRVPTNENKVPVDPVTIESVKIVKSGNPPPLAEPVPYKPPIPMPQFREVELP